MSTRGNSHLLGRCPPVCSHEQCIQQAATRVLNRAHSSRAVLSPASNGQTPRRKGLRRGGRLQRHGRYFGPLLALLALGSSHDQFVVLGATRRSSFRRRQSVAPGHRPLGGAGRSTSCCAPCLLWHHSVRALLHPIGVRKPQSRRAVEAHHGRLFVHGGFNVGELRSRPSRVERRTHDHRGLDRVRTTGISLRPTRQQANLSLAGPSGLAVKAPSSQPKHPGSNPRGCVFRAHQHRPSRDR